MQSEPRIAVVGIGGLFPGADTLDAYWRNVRDAVDASSEPPPGRWLLTPDECFDPAVGTPDRVYSRRAYFLGDIPLDPAGLPFDAARLDPAFRLILHAGRQAFADARTQNTDPRRVGVVLGNIALPTDGASALADGDGEPLNRFVAGLPAGVLARALGLGGGTFTLDAACASSLYAIKLACDELRAGRADAMLAGGMSRPDSLYTQMGFAQLRALSPTGRCSPFDAAGDGLVVGEGAGVFVLKRLDDALRDGDHVYATLAGCGLSNDVDGNLLAPASEGQLRAMRDAYRRAGWRPGDVDLIECHATGTAVGDRTEFASYRELWADEVWRPGQCVLGSAKANVGHLLTAAGSAGLIRVLLAMKHATLPPTANFLTPAPDVDLHDSPFAILGEARPWERRAGLPRRAAVSAFGFGGINAHLLVEEFLPENAPPVGRDRPRVVSVPGEPVAVVGMDARFGPWQSLRAFGERVLGGGDPHAPAVMRPDGDAVGYGIPEVAVPLGRFRTPPSELRELLPQQLLALTSAAAALDDAGLSADSPAELRHRTGVFLGVSLDLNTTNFHLRWKAIRDGRDPDSEGPPLSADRTMGGLASIAASRVARAFGVGGPSFTVSSEDTSAAHALALGVRALQRGELDRAVVGGVDLCGDPRAVRATHAGRPYASGGLARPFDADAEGPLPGDGAATVVLKRLADAVRDGDRVYAVVRGVGLASGGGVETWLPSEQAYAEALRRAYLDAAVHPATVEMVEAHGSGSPPEDALEAGVLARLFPEDPLTPQPPLPQGERASKSPAVMLSSAKADVGHAGAASALAGLVKAALCLHHEVLPPVRHSTQPRPELAGSRLRVPQHPRFWLHDSADGPRRAGLSSLSVDGNCVHVVLEESPTPRPPDEPSRSQPLGARPEGLFAVEADDVAGLRDGLAELTRFADAAGPEAGIEGLARAWWRKRPTDPRRQLGLALVARRPAELREQVAFVTEHLYNFADDALPGRESAAASGSLRDRLFYDPAPLGPTGQLGFVFPGSGSHFAGMGRDIGVHWPEVLRRQQATNGTLRGQYAADVYWPAGNRLEAVDGLSAIWAQVSLGTLVGDLLRSFGVRPDAVIGQSLGESAGLFTLGAWTERDEMYRRMTRSTLFTHDLAGEYRAARVTWRLPADAPPVEWLTGVVASSEEAVRAALEPGGRA